MEPVNRGRPVYGAEPKSAEHKVRLEPTMLERLRKTCAEREITVNEGIREGIRMFLAKYERRK